MRALILLFRRPSDPGAMATSFENTRTTMFPGLRTAIDHVTTSGNGAAASWDVEKVLTLSSDAGVELND